jgi:hypothetical protein
MQVSKTPKAHSCLGRLGSIPRTKQATDLDCCSASAMPVDNSPSWNIVCVRRMVLGQRVVIGVHVCCEDIDSKSAEQKVGEVWL